MLRKKAAKLKDFWVNSNVEIKVNKREMLLGIAACSLAGVLLGVLLGKEKHVVIGSNNINGSDALKAGNILPEKENCEKE